MKRLPFHAILLLLPFSLIAPMQAEIASTGNPASTNSVQTISLSSVGLKKAHQYGFWTPEPGRTFDKNVPTVAGIQDKSGVSVRGESIMAYDLHGDARKLTAMVGVDDEVKESFQGPAECLVYGDGKLLWRSGQLKTGESAVKCDLDVRGVKVLELVVEAYGDDVYQSHIDWLNATLSYSGKKPENIEPPALPSEFEILTPKVSSTPRINGPRIFGVRPGSPFLFTIAASGDRPMKFSASGLPEGLTLDPGTGRITGFLKKAGEHTVTLHAANVLGSTERSLRIVVGDKISLAPPMGWSSWNCWAKDVDQEKVLRAAHAMVDSGLAQHGFTFINIDDAWQAKRSGPLHALQGNKKFPDMKSLCDEIHNLGLKAGIYSTPWVQSYAGYPGGSSDNAEGAWVKQKEHGGIGKYCFLPNDARQWGAWGFDYLKCDWYPPKPNEVGTVAEALRKSDRDIILSVSCDAPFKYAAGYPAVANSWRTTTDINDTWQTLSGIAFSQDHWAPFGGPGHWIDPDMMEVGNVGHGKDEGVSPTHLTPDEQYLHVSMWCLLSAPLILGCDLEKLDDFTKGLLTNDEVLDIDQDLLGKPARRLLSQGNVQVWVKDLEDGSKAVGVFNLGRDAAKTEVPWSRIGIMGGQSVRDLWRQKELGEFPDSFQTTVRPHGVVLLKVSTSRKLRIMQRTALERTPPHGNQRY